MMEAGAYEASIVFAAAGIIFAVIFFVVKAIVGHLLASWVGKELTQWRRRRKERRDVSPKD